jgi:hypothetical protein
MDLISTPILVAIISGTFLVVNTTLNYLFSKNISLSSKVINKNAVIALKLREFRSKWNIDRVNAIFYHNGGTYFSGESQDKFTIRYEATSTETSKIQTAMTNMSVSILEDMPFLLKSNVILIDNNIASSIKNAKKETDVPLYYYLLNDYGVEESIIKGLYKRVFRLKNLLEFKLFSVEMVASIHIHWNKENQSLASIYKDPIHRMEFIKELAEIADILVEKRAHVDNIERIFLTRLESLYYKPFSG